MADGGCAARASVRATAQPAEAGLEEVVAGGGGEHIRESSTGRRRRDAETDDGQGAPGPDAASARDELAHRAPQPPPGRPWLAVALDERLPHPRADLLPRDHLRQREC